MPVIALLITLLGGCALSRQPSDAPGPSAAPPPVVDSPPVGDPPPVRDCAPHAHRGCSDSEYQWFWNGTDCEVQFDCSNTGLASYRACLFAHRACGAPAQCEPMPEVVDEIACEPVDVFVWDGTACVHDVVCPQNANGLFRNRGACTEAYTACGIDTECGPVVGLGTHVLELQVLEPLPQADGCRRWPGDRWLARAVFVAPEDGFYMFDAAFDIAISEHLDLSFFSGRCSDERTGCSDESEIARSQRWMSEGETVTVYVKPEYDAAPEEAVVAYAGHVGLQIWQTE